MDFQSAGGSPTRSTDLPIAPLLLDNLPHVFSPEIRATKPRARLKNYRKQLDLMLFDKQGFPHLFGAPNNGNCISSDVATHNQSETQFMDASTTFALGTFIALLGGMIQFTAPVGFDKQKSTYAKGRETLSPWGYALMIAGSLIVLGQLNNWHLINVWTLNTFNHDLLSNFW